MNSTTDHILIELDTLFNNEIETSVVSKEGEKLKLMLDPSFEPHKYIKRCAQVVGIPNTYTSEPITARHHQTPKSRENPTEFLSTADFPDPDIRVGDSVYYHYLSVRPDKEDAPSVSFVKRADDGKQIHYVRNKELQCIVRDEEIIMLFGNILIEPAYDDNIKEVDVNGVDVKCKVSSGGIIISVGAESKLQHGKVAHITPTSFELSRNDVKPGDEVLYRKNSEFENEIEGEDYYLMKEWDLIAKKVDGEYIPLCDYTLVKVEKEEDKSLIINPNKKDKKEAKAEIIKVGNKCNGPYKIGDTVHVNIKTPFAIEHDEYLFLNEGEILGIYE